MDDFVGEAILCLPQKGAWGLWSLVSSFYACGNLGSESFCEFNSFLHKRVHSLCDWTTCTENPKQDSVEGCWLPLSLVLPFTPVPHGFPSPFAWGDGEWCVRVGGTLPLHPD